MSERCQSCYDLRTPDTYRPSSTTCDACLLRLCKFCSHTHKCETVIKQQLVQAQLQVKELREEAESETIRQLRLVVDMLNSQVVERDEDLVKLRERVSVSLDEYQQLLTTNCQVMRDHTAEITELREKYATELRTERELASEQRLTSSGQYEECISALESEAAALTVQLKKADARPDLTLQLQTELHEAKTHLASVEEEKILLIQRYEQELKAKVKVKGTPPVKRRILLKKT